MNGRDEHGHFVKGHPDFVKGTGAKIGRPKSFSHQVKDALDAVQDAEPQLYRDMLRDALDPDTPLSVRQDIREYLCDRLRGKPNLPITGPGGKDLVINFVIGKGYNSSSEESSANGD